MSVRVTFDREGFERRVNEAGVKAMNKHIENRAEKVRKLVCPVHGLSPTAEVEPVPNLESTGEMRVGGVCCDEMRAAIKAAR